MFSHTVIVMSLAIYRRYRPKTLSEVVGQETTINILKNAAGLNRLGHAYLFYGPRGTGKTTVSRLLAKLLNCHKRASDPKFQKTGEPCNSCPACESIDSGSSLDVIEIDAASNRGIDEIRNLKESIRSLPTGGQTKVCIIDEVHMLTGPAFNALLKTLEEPPAHGALILATTEFEKLPATIVSRCQRFLFRKPTKKEILSKLTDIVTEEKLKIEPAALEAIAAAAEGSFRDAESLLDQLSSATTGLDLKSVEAVTGRVGLARVENLAHLIVSSDLSQAIAYAESLNQEGANLAQIVKDLIHYFRKVLALRANSDLEKVIADELTKEELEKVKDLSRSIEPEKLIRLMKSLITAYQEMRYSPFTLVPLQIALWENLNK